MKSQLRCGVGTALAVAYVFFLWLAGAFFLLRYVFEIHRGHWALLIVYFVMSAIIQGLWSAIFRLFR